MVLDLTGVLEDGGPALPGVPANPRRTIAAPRGSSLTIRLLVLRRSGQPEPLGAAGTTVTLSIRRGISDGEPPVLLKAGTVNLPDGEGRADFALGVVDWAALSTGRYLYDVLLRRGSGTSNDYVVPASPFLVEPTASLLPPPPAGP